MGMTSNSASGLLSENGKSNKIDESTDGKGRAIFRPCPLAFDEGNLVLYHRMKRL
jgi:hypothetical protein